VGPFKVCSGPPVFLVRPEAAILTKFKQTSSLENFSGNNYLSGLGTACAFPPTLNPECTCLHRTECTANRPTYLPVWHVVLAEPDVPRRISDRAQPHVISRAQVCREHVTRDHVTGCDVTQLRGQLVRQSGRRTYNAQVGYLRDNATPRSSFQS